MPAAPQSKPRAWPRRVRRVTVAVSGTAVLTLGLAMVVLPGPALLLIPAGLAILATEFPWARRLLERGRPMLGKTLEKLHLRRPAREPAETQS